MNKLTNTNAHRIILTLVICSIIIISFVTYRHMLTYTFIGSDAITFVDVCRIDSIQDVRTICTEAVFERSSFSKLGKFYRPLLVLSYSLDHFLWQLNPFGYHLTHLILHTIACVLVFFLALFLTNGQRLVAWLSAVIFTLHPIHIDILPLIASSRQESAFTISIILTLLAFFKYHRDDRRKVYLYLSLLFYILALGFKETAIIFVPLIVIYIVTFSYRSEQSFRENVMNAVRTLSPLIIASVLYLAWRTYILKGLGGYVVHNFAVATSIRPSDSIVLVYLQIMKNIIVQYFGYLLLPVAFLKSHGMSGLSSHKIVIIATAIATGAILMSIYRMSSNPRLRIDNDANRAGHTIKIVFFLVAWLLMPLCLYMIFRVFSTRYLYVSVVPISIIVALMSVRIIQDAVVRLREGVSTGSRWRGLYRFTSGSIVLAIMLGAFIVYSPVVRANDEMWDKVNEMNGIFIRKFNELVAGMPDGAKLHLHHVPMIGLHTYTLQSWINVTNGSKGITVDVVRSPDGVGATFKDIGFRVMENDGMDIHLDTIYEE